MGTLTAHTSRLPEHCIHKLPTSCRLTSIANCCACADERAHSPSYSTYVDGVGYVARASRWQRYCWFCKTFWENRVEASQLRPSQTRIPHVPDQTHFLDTWYDFHRGYRLIHRDDGSEERVAVLGEPFRDVDPGRLPRSLDELRAGYERSAADRPQHLDEQIPVETHPVPSLDDTLQSLLDQASADAEADMDASAEPPPQQTPLSARDSPDHASLRVAGQAMQATRSRNREYQNRRIAALRRELHRMRNGIERVITGLRELGEMVPDPSEATGRLASLGRTLDSLDPTADSDSDLREPPIPPAPAAGALYRDASQSDHQQRLQEAEALFAQARRFRAQSARDLENAQASLEEARRHREDAAEVLEGADIDLAEHRAQFSQVRREQQTARNMTRVFGTREEMESQGNDYVSPIGGMFTRAWDRFRVAEDVRREERILTQALQDEQHVPDDSSIATNTVQEDHLNEYYSLLRLQGWSQQSQSQPDRAGAAMPLAASASTGTNGEQDPARDQDTNSSADQPLLVTSPGTSTLARLLRQTPEPERTAIIARMTENGTAQALDNSLSSFENYRRPDTLRMLLRSSLGAQLPDPEDDDTRNPHQGLDAVDSGRPDPKDDQDMMFRLDCKICYTQIADTACLPCGHLVMCNWCSDQHSPVMLHDRTRPRGLANCPVCRKRVKQKVRIYRA